MTFVYDGQNQNCFDAERGIEVRVGGGGYPRDQRPQRFNFIHDDWEFVSSVFIEKIGVHVKFLEELSQYGRRKTVKTYDDGARINFVFAGGKFRRGEREKNSELNDIIKDGIYCLMTHGGEDSVPVYFNLPRDVRDIPYSPQLTPKNI